MLLDSFLETPQGGLLVQSQKPPGPTSPTGMCISNGDEGASAEAGREPVGDPVVDRVERAVGAVDGNAGGGTAQEGRLERVGEGEGGDGFEDWRMVRDDHGCGQRERFIGDARRQVDRQQDIVGCTLLLIRSL